ncbi:MAG TPA: PilZ domain-containing protein, partial [Polyangiaceae bacterium LLY-WYZ-15_(1-7)]|nr:PilZ domain-containing protein [Polyangiaceae bacterium LLY-WYZ-15_(1-7)]
RIVRGTRRSDRGRALGVRFDRLAPIDAALLAASLRGFPPPAPARRVRRDYAGTVSLLMAS